MDSSSTSAQQTDQGRPRHIPHMRLWFYGYVAALAAAVFVFLSGVVAPPYHWLILYVVYLSLASNALPLPTWWIVLFIGRDFNPVLAALLGALGTMVSTLNEYHFFYFWFRYDRVDALRRRRISQRLLGWVERRPFLTIAAAAFLPIPWDFIRMMAIASGYSRPKFALASFVGRFARYLPLTLTAHGLQVSNLWIIIVQAAIVVAALVFVIVDRRRGARGRKEPSCSDE